MTPEASPPWSGGDTLDVLDVNHLTGAATYHWNDGNWHHYCLTFSAATGRKVYIDGNALVSDTKDVGHPITPTGNLFIGCRQDTDSARLYGGGVDEVIMMNQVLDANAVKALMVPVNNLAPSANAGPSAKVMIPNALRLAGSISDDGQPNPPGACSAAWSKISGPGTVTFANAAALSTTATFSTAGTYVLQLTASDSVLTGTSNITVTALATGDFNGDGKVDGVDFLIWQSHYPNNVGGATPDGGDANADGRVDGVDFLIWQSHYHG